MPAPWTHEQLTHFDEEGELEIAGRRLDGTFRRFQPIWVVRVGSDVVVRSWHRRSTGWFGDVVATGRGRVRVPGLEAEVAVEDLGDSDPVVTAAVDDAYRAKYAPGSTGTVSDMVTADARLTTLRLTALDPDRGAT